MKGPQCHFYLDLVSTKMTLNALRTYCHFVRSNESGDKRNLVTFFFTFSGYENETKRDQKPFSWLRRVQKRNQIKLGVIFFCLESVVDPNSALNHFSCFCNLNKY